MSLMVSCTRLGRVFRSYMELLVVAELRTSGDHLGRVPSRKLYASGTGTFPYLARPSSHRDFPQELTAVYKYELAATRQPRLSVCFPLLSILVVLFFFYFLSYIPHSYIYTNPSTVLILISASTTYTLLHTQARHGSSSYIHCHPSQGCVDSL